MTSEDDDLPPPSLDDLPGFQSLESAYADDNEDPNEDESDGSVDFYTQLENLGMFQQK